MTDDLMQLARQCCDVETDQRGRESFDFDSYGIERFAALIEQRTIERCAAVCDQNAADDRTGYGVAEDCAIAIRALGAK